MIFHGITPKQMFHVEAGLHIFSQSIVAIVANIPRRLMQPLSHSSNTLTLGLLLEELQDELGFIWSNRTMPDTRFDELLTAWVGLGNTIRFCLPKFGDVGHVGRALRLGNSTSPVLGVWLAIQLLTKQLAQRYTEITGRRIAPVDIGQYVHAFYIALDQSNPMCRFVKTVSFEDQVTAAKEALKARLRAKHKVSEGTLQPSPSNASNPPAGA
jgi:hypothetical protein